MPRLNTAPDPIKLGPNHLKLCPEGYGEPRRLCVFRASKWISTANLILDDGWSFFAATHNRVSPVTPPFRPNPSKHARWQELMNKGLLRPLGTLGTLPCLISWSNQSGNAPPAGKTLTLGPPGASTQCLVPAP